MDQGAVGLVLDLAKAFPGYAFQLPKEDLAGVVRLLRASEAGAVRRKCGGAAYDHHGHLAWANMEFFVSTYRAAGRIE